MNYSLYDLLFIIQTIIIERNTYLIFDRKRFFLNIYCNFYILENFEIVNDIVLHFFLWVKGTL